MRTSKPATLFLSALVLFVGLNSRPAHAFEITAVGGLNYGAPSQTLGGISQQQTGDAAAAFGVLAAVNLFDSSFDLESGVIFATQQSDYQTLPVFTRKISWTIIPAVVRYNFDENLAIGAGAYAAFAGNNSDQIQNGFTTTINYSALNLSPNDAGMIANSRARFAVAPPFYFIIDARYLYGLKNLALNGIDVYNTRSVEAFVGISYRFATQSASAPNPE